MKLVEFDVLDEDIAPEEIDVSSLVPQKELNPEIWNGLNLRDDVREIANKIADNYTQAILNNLKNLKIIDVQFTGSLANYNWSSYSDFDIHVVVDYSKISDNIDLVGEYFRNKTTIYSLTHIYSIKGFEVELNTNNIEPIKKDVGIYSLLHNKWLQIPNKDNIVIDYSSVRHKTAQLINAIDNAACDLKDLKKIKKKIRKMRQTAIDSRGEFATENLAFKILRRIGYLKKLKDQISELEAKI